MRYEFLAGIAVSIALTATGPAFASDRWEEAASGAVAILPEPSESEGIMGGSLYCKEQKWAFLFRTLGVDTGALGDKATIGIEGQTLDVTMSVSPGSIDVPVPAQLIELVKQGNRFRFEAAKSDIKARAIFSLRNSGAVIDTIAPRCSPVDMSGYETVTLSDAGVPADTARTLFADEIKLVVGATGKQPTAMATQIDVDGGRKLLFGQLCTSGSYYGKSKCTLWGWAATAPDAAWRAVYATEGVHLYLDRKVARDGWPGLATVPLSGGSDISLWSWDGSAYRAEGATVAADEVSQPDDDAAGQ